MPNTGILYPNGVKRPPEEGGEPEGAADRPVCGAAGALLWPEDDAVGQRHRRDSGRQAGAKGRQCAGNAE